MLEDACAPQEWCPPAWKERCSHKGHSRSGEQDRIGEPCGKLWKCSYWNFVQSKAGKADSSMEKCPLSCLLWVGEPTGAPKIQDVPGWEVLGEGQGIFYQIYASTENSSPFYASGISQRQQIQGTAVPSAPTFPAKLQPGLFLDKSPFSPSPFPWLNSPWPQRLLPCFPLNSSGFGIPLPQIPSKSTSRPFLG